MRRRTAITSQTTANEYGTVEIQAKCGHYDTYRLKPGEHLRFMGERFTLCSRCSFLSDTTGER